MWAFLREFLNIQCFVIRENVLKFRIAMVNHHTISLVGFIRLCSDAPRNITKVMRIYLLPSKRSSLLQP